MRNKYHQIFLKIFKNLVFILIYKFMKVQLWLFRNSHIWKLYVQTNPEVHKNEPILENKHPRQNRSARHLLCLPIATQHNIYFFEIYIFQNFIFFKNGLWYRNFVYGTFFYMLRATWHNVFISKNQNGGVNKKIAFWIF